jgi:hypothetical protein
VGELVKGSVEAVSSLGDGEMEERSFRWAGLLKGKRWRWRNPHKALDQKQHKGLKPEKVLIPPFIGPSS